MPILCPLVLYGNFSAKGLVHVIPDHFVVRETPLQAHQFRYCAFHRAVMAADYAGCLERDISTLPARHWLMFTIVTPFRLAFCKSLISHGRFGALPLPKLLITIDLSSGASRTWCMICSCRPGNSENTTTLGSMAVCGIIGLLKSGLRMYSSWYMILTPASAK